MGPMRSFTEMPARDLITLVLTGWFVSTLRTVVQDRLGIASRQQSRMIAKVASTRSRPC